MKLYEIANDYLSLMEAIENGEIPEEALADTLESIESGIEEKADNIACMLKNLSAEIAAIKAEENNLAERRKQREKTHERLKEYLSSTLQRVGKTKIETARNLISFRKSESVEIDEEAFAKWAWAAKRDDLLIYTAKANKTEVKRELNNGVEMFGACIVKKQNIQIK